MHADRIRLRRAGIALEVVTLGWNVVGVVLLAVLAYRSGSVALLGFGLDSLIEIGASTVVIWELTGADERRQRLGMRLIGIAFVLLAVYLLAQAAIALATGHRAVPLTGGIVWTGLTAVAMVALAAGKRRVGRLLADPVLLTEGEGDPGRRDPRRVRAARDRAGRLARLVVGRPARGARDRVLRDPGGRPRAAPLSAYRGEPRIALHGKMQFFGALR